jgi:hypothetical protein
MTYDDRELGELLRLLPAAPEHLVARAKELPLHFGEDFGEEGAAGDDHEPGTAPHHDDEPQPPFERDAGVDPFAEDDPPDGEWG